MKQLAFVQHADRFHWVGDGFPVRQIFSYTDLGAELSPFLMLDYAGPKHFAPTERRRGVGEHPHRGFETVTIVYHGEVAHRDSSGGGGLIGPGDVQWMTAASGIVHDEYHGPDFARGGGLLQMVQLWVNLPAHHKMDAPRYQAITSNKIPSVTLPKEAGVVRVIAGQYESARGPANTYTRMSVLDVRLKSGARAVFETQDGDTAALVILQGRAKIGNLTTVYDAGMAMFERRGRRIEVDALDDTTALLLTGDPINEPVVGQGPFVMNTQSEIAQAFIDYSSGKMGHIVD